MTISSRGWLGIAMLLAAGAVSVIVLSRSGQPTQPARSTSSTKQASSAAHPAMTPLKVQIDDAASLEAALEQNPGHSPILMRMAELAREQGDLRKAVTHLRQAVEAEDTNLDARLELGRALYESGDVEGAIQETNRILDRAPNHVDALYNLGAIYANQSQPDLAAEYWSRAVASDPASESGGNAQRGLDILAGQAGVESPRPSVAIPDIPEHRNIRRTRQASAADPKKALIEFATKH